MKRFKSADEYFDATANWRPELTKLRRVLLSSSLQETVKWGAPVYTSDGKNIVGIAAFKQWVALWFFQGALLKDPYKLLMNAQEEKTQAMRQWRITDSKQIKVAQLEQYIAEAIQLSRSGISIKPRRDNPLIMPDELKNALTNNKKAGKVFEGMSKSCQREYAEYVAEAKKPETKLRRLEKILPMIESGGGLNDKYR
jgi:uncharacterized protein YdeI (YjbR/CyaY-like superfamily)